MKKSLLLMVPLLLTTAFAFSQPSYNETISTENVEEIENEAIDNATFGRNIGEETTYSNVSEELVDDTDSATSDQIIEEESAVREKNERKLSDEELLEEALAGVDELTIEEELEEEEEEEADAEPEAEPVVPDPFASEPYSESSLKDCEKYFEQAHELASASREYTTQMQAIIAGSSENRVFRRNCEFLTRVANQNLYAAKLALQVLPKLFTVSNRLVAKSISTIMNTFVDELSDEQLAREIRLSELNELFDRQLEFVGMLQTFVNNSKRFIELCQQQSKQRHTQGDIPEFLRRNNRKALALLSRQVRELEDLLALFDHHYHFCQINLDYFLAVSENAPAIMQGAQIGRLLKSVEEFTHSLDRYQKTYAAFARKFKIIIDQRLSDMPGLCKNRSQYANRIADFYGNYPKRDLDNMPEPEFTAQTQLKQAFELLQCLNTKSLQLIKDDTSANIAKPVDNETFRDLKINLERHLISKNWPITSMDTTTTESE